MKLGYCRVSTEDQNLERQIAALQTYGCDQLFLEKKSGKNRHRPELERLLSTAQAGDIVVVQKLDRLGRSTIDLIEITDQLRAKGVDFVSLSESFDTTTPVGRLYFNIMAILAQFEREQTLERVKDGIRVAKQNGKHLGRPCKVDGTLVYSAFRNGVPVNEIAAQYNVSYVTIYRHINKQIQTEQRKGTGL